MPVGSRRARYRVMSDVAATSRWTNQITHGDIKIFQRRTPIATPHVVSRTGISPRPNGGSTSAPSTPSSRRAAACIDALLRLTAFFVAFFMLARFVVANVTRRVQRPTCVASFHQPAPWHQRDGPADPLGATSLSATIILRARQQPLDKRDRKSTRLTPVT